MQSAATTALSVHPTAGCDLSAVLPGPGSDPLPGPRRSPGPSAGSTSHLSRLYLSRPRPRGVTHDRHLKRLWTERVWSAGTAVVPPEPRPDINRKRLARMGWGFSAPALIVIAAVTIFPIVYSVIMSLNNVNVTGSGFSLDGFTFSNYNLLIHASLWRDALFFTVYYTVVTVIVELVARHLHRARARAPGRRARLDDGAAAHPLVDDHRHQRRAVGLHLQRDGREKPLSSCARRYRCQRSAGHAYSHDSAKCGRFIHSESNSASASGSARRKPYGSGSCGIGGGGTLRTSALISVSCRGRITSGSLTSTAESTPGRVSTSGFSSTARPAL